MEQHIIDEIKQMRIENNSYKYIGKKFNLSSYKISKICKDIILSNNSIFEINSKARSTYTYNNDIIDANKNIAYYLLGAFITDGCVRKNYKEITLTSKDEDWLKDIYKIMVQEDRKLYELKHTKCFNLSISDHKFINWFISNGVTPAKSMTARLPQIPEQYIVDVLRGIIDGDGSIIFRNGRNGSMFKSLNVQIVSASKQLIQDISYLLNILNLSHSLSEPKTVEKKIRGRYFTPTHQIYRIHMCTLPSMKLCNIMYYTGCLCLNRKRINYDNFINHRKNIISKIIHKPEDELTHSDIFKNYGGCKRTQITQ